LFQLCIDLAATGAIECQHLAAWSEAAIFNLQPQLCVNETRPASGTV